MSVMIPGSEHTVNGHRYDGEVSNHGNYGTYVVTYTHFKTDSLLNNQALKVTPWTKTVLKKWHKHCVLVL